MNKFLIIFSIVATTLARPDGLLDGNDGHVTVTQSSLGTYKYTVHLKDSFRIEERLADGTIFGEYTIPDANGNAQIIKYSAGRDGFRILEGLPVAPLDHSISIDEHVDVLGSRNKLVLPVGTTQGQLLPVNTPPLRRFV